MIGRVLVEQQLEVLASEFRVWRVDNKIKLPQPIVGRAEAAKTRGDTSDGPGPINVRRGG